MKRQHHTLPGLRTIGLCLFAFAFITLLLVRDRKPTIEATQAPVLSQSVTAVPTDLRVLPKNCPNNPSSFTAPVTLVTSYFELAASGKSKHAQNEYHTWHGNFFPAICTPMVIFTTPSELPRISALRNGKPTLFHLYDSIWDLPWVKSRAGLQDLYTQQRALDWHGWAKAHSPELYAVWNAKSWMLSSAAEANHFNSSHFFWMDSGSVRKAVRTRVLHSYPEPQKVREVFEDPKNHWRSDRLHVFGIDSLKSWMPGTKFNISRSVQETVAGCFFGGRRETVIRFAKKFSQLHDKFLAEGEFVGVDQFLYNWMFYNYPEGFMVTTAYDVKELRVGGADDVWFFYELWYGKDSDPAWKRAEVRNVTDYLKRYSDAYAKSLVKMW